MSDSGSGSGFLSSRIDELGEELGDIGGSKDELQRTNELLEIIALNAVGEDQSYVDTSTDDPDERGSGRYSAFAGIGVTADEQAVTWGYQADAVAVKGFDEPILLALKSQDHDARWIDLRPDDDPFSIGGDVSIDAGRCFFRLAPNAAENTTITVIALKDR